jgi:hypothetical protein
MSNPFQSHTVNARKVKVCTVQKSFTCCSVNFICHIYARVCVCVCVLARVRARLLRMESILRL